MFFSNIEEIEAFEMIFQNWCSITLINNVLIIINLTLFPFFNHLALTILLLVVKRYVSSSS